MVFLVCALMLLGLVGRLVYLMGVRSDYYYQKAEELHERERVIKAARGQILDAKGRILADNKTVCTISVIHSQIKEPQKVIEVLSKELEIDTDTVRKKVEKISSIERIKTNVEKSVGDVIRGYELDGVKVDEDYKRYYPYGSLASKVLGFTGSDNQGIIGLEVKYEEILKGQAGKILTTTDARGVEIDQIGESREDPVAGENLKISLDVDLQQYAQQAALKVMEEKQAARVSILLMNPQNGEIYVCVNVPEFDLNDPFILNTDVDTSGLNEQEKQDLLNQMWRNQCVNDTYEPGSTFKTASIMVALEDGKITPDYVVDTGNGQMPMYGRVMKDHNWHRGGYGKLTVTEILGVSSNVGTSYIIDHFYGSNPQKFVDGLKRMSIDQPLHLQISGEGKPNIRGPKERYFAKTTLPWMSIGYETQVPPINILTFYNGIANNGVSVRPKFVKAAVKDGEVVKEYPTEVINPKICSDKTLTQIREILRKVVGEGLAKPAGSKQFHVSGKTGTAQISQGAAGYKTGRTNYLVSFCGYFPSEAPKYSMIVSIQKPGLPASGGLMAVPVLPETWNCLLPAGLASPSPTTFRRISRICANVLSEQIFGLITSVGYSFTTSPSLTAALTNFGRMDTPLLAIASRSSSCGS